MVSAPTTDPDSRADTVAAYRVVAGTQRDRARPGGPRALRRPRASRRRRSSSRVPRAPGSGTPRAASTSTSPAASAAPTSATRLPAVVEAMHEQVDRYLHQCFMVGMYEPYVEVCRRLAELSPCRGDRPEVDPAEHAAPRRSRTRSRSPASRPGRPAVVVFDSAFHGRTLLSMTMTSKVVPYKAGFGPFAPEVYRTPAPYPFRGDQRGRRDRRRSSSSSRATSTRASVACAVLEPVQGEGGFIPMTPDFPRRLQELLDHYGILYVDDEVQSGCGRTGPGLGDRALRRRARPARLAARRSAAACRSRRSPAAPR